MRRCLKMYDKKDGWKSKISLLLSLSELHDIQFRKNHTCGENCNQVIYQDGRWYCESMEKSRSKNKELKKIKKELLLESPFLPESIESAENILQKARILKKVN